MEGKNLPGIPGNWRRLRDTSLGLCIALALSGTAFAQNDEGNEED